MHNCYIITFTLQINYKNWSLILWINYVSYGASSQSAFISYNTYYLMKGKRAFISYADYYNYEIGNVTDISLFGQDVV